MGSPASVTYGPIFIGVMFNILLYGIMITQTYLYFQKYKRDKPWMKLFVLFLFVCDSLNCAFDIAFLYDPLITNYGNVEALNVATWGYSSLCDRSVMATSIPAYIPILIQHTRVDPAMTAIIGMLVQMFFAWRVKVLTSSWIAVGTIAVCSFAQFCGGLGTAIAVGMIPQFVQFQKFQVIVIIWLAFSAVADTLVTASLVWHLRTHRTGMLVTDDVIDRIIRLTVQTGLITALCAIVDLVLFLVSPTGLHLIFNLPLSKLYTNSLMSSLNSRQGWHYDTSRGASQNREQARGLHMPRNVNVNVSRSDHSRRLPQQIYIDVEQHEMIDVIDMKGASYIGGDSGATFKPDQKTSDVSERTTVQTVASDSMVMESAAT
ncbi:hypothetical protein C8Q73DRAFT_146699 [Cubamyces lactineus]|nr:hypothetical protein C8Q73DRAFT_146699 [Cubamyces lactineus]